MKVRTLLVAAVMFFALSVAAFAQASFSVASTPVTAVIQNGLTEKTGDVVFSITAVGPTGASAAGTISISYSGIPITSAQADTTTCDPQITVTGTAGNGGTLVGAALNASTNCDSLAAGIVIIDVPAGGHVGNTITVSGVRVAVANTGLTSLNAQVSSTVNSITAGQTVVQVIASIQPAITVSSEDVTINSVSGKDADGHSTVTADMIAKEVFLNAFGLAVDDTAYPADTGSLWVRFTLSAAPVEGITLSFPVHDVSGAFTQVDSKGVAVTSATEVNSTTDTPIQIYYALTSDSDPTTIETLDVAVTVTGGEPVVGATNISFTATVAPIGVAKVTPTSLIPRYTVSESAAQPLVNFTGSNTVLLIPYASVATEIGYDTGLAISNTTVDPGADNMGGIEGATPQPGSFTVYFFPQSGTDFSVASTAAGFPGSGLDATGKIPAGGTFVALLSEIVKAAQAANSSITIPDDFTGYLVIVTNFTNAHGLCTVSNFQTYTQASPILILPTNQSRLSESGLNN